MCVPWESNPQPFELLTQCSTTEPQEHLNSDPERNKYRLNGGSKPLYEHMIRKLQLSAG